MNTETEQHALKDSHWFLSGIERDWPAMPEPIIPWGERELGIPATVGNVSTFESTLTPWTTFPIVSAASGNFRKITYVGPIQSGKSTIGELLICYWMLFEQGLIQYNWEDDEKAGERWKKRIAPILEACRPVWRRIEAQRSVDRTKVVNCLVVLPNVSLMVQGSFTGSNLDSDSVRLQVNEEIHNWKPGRLKMAYGRTTKFWDYIIVNLSNASNVGDQLHEAFLAGTQQHWEVKCPGCGLYHRMRTKWDKEHPELGGLRYESNPPETGRYDYEKIKGTIRYQMPCGYLVHDDPAERRPLALSGKYSEPENKGAPAHELSCTLDAVSTDYSWLELIKEKHEALAALRRGDVEPWIKYVTRREAQFYDAENRIVVNQIILSDSKKDRDGIKERSGRFGALDRQQGSIDKGELPHWWGLIQDIKLNEDGTLHVLTVWEGKLLTDNEAAAVMKRHDVKPSCVVADSGFDAVHVYQFCLEHGFSAIKGADDPLFSHPDGTRKIFSPEKPLHAMINALPTRQDPLEEPLFWFYSKPGIMDRLAWLRSAPSVRYEVPGDVSQDFINHMDSWSYETRKVGRTNETVGQWKQHKVRDDMYCCAGYCAMLFEMAGLIGAAKPSRKGTDGTDQKET